jgi:hypothetical protein
MPDFASQLTWPKEGWKCLKPSHTKACKFPKKSFICFRFLACANRFKQAWILPLRTVTRSCAKTRCNQFTLVTCRGNSLTTLKPWLVPPWLPKLLWGCAYGVEKRGELRKSPFLSGIDEDLRQAVSKPMDWESYDLEKFHQCAVGSSKDFPSRC